MIRLVITVTGPGAEARLQGIRDAAMNALGPAQAGAKVTFDSLPLPDIVIHSKRAIEAGVFSLSRFAALAVLAGGEDKCLATLGKAIGTTAGAFTDIADTLVEKGLATSHACPLDRRKRMLRITEKGLAIFVGEGVQDGP